MCPSSLLHVDSGQRRQSCEHSVRAPRSRTVMQEAMPRDARRRSSRTKGRDSRAGTKDLDGCRGRARTPSGRQVAEARAGSVDVRDGRQVCERDDQTQVRDEQGHGQERVGGLWEDLPQQGAVIEVEWWVPLASAPSPDQSSDQEDDDFQPRKRGSASKARQSKRVKRTRRKDELIWWPAVVVSLRKAENSAVRGVLKYTEKDRGHGIFPGAGEEEFDGEEWNVEFANHFAIVDLEPTLHHISDTNGKRYSNPWRHFKSCSRAGERVQPLENDSADGDVLREIRILKRTVAELQAIVLRLQMHRDHHGPSSENETDLFQRCAVPGTAHIGDVRARDNAENFERQEPPATVREQLKNLRIFGLEALTLSLMAATPPTSTLKNICTSPLGEQDGLGAVRGSTLIVHDSTKATVSEFIALARWLAQTQSGRPRDRVTVFPSLEEVNSAGFADSCRVQFETYGEFCDAIEVPMCKRPIFLWEKWTSHVSESKASLPSVCVVGSVQVIESCFGLNGPLRRENQRITHSRVVLPGRSWRALAGSGPGNEDNSAGIPHLRQTGVRVNMEIGDSENGFLHDPDVTVASLREESARTLPEAADAQSSFDIVWTPSNHVDGIPWTRKDTPGRLSFRIPVVFIRSPALVRSTRRILGDHDENYPNESDDDKLRRRQRSLELRRKAARPPQHTRVV